MLLLIMLTIIGIDPNPHLRSMAEIRHTMNRIDGLSLASLDALSHKAAQENKALGNKERYEQVKILLCDFATTKLDISMPLNNVEDVVIDGLAKKASQIYDVTPAPKSLTLVGPQSTFEQIIPTKGWYNTRDHGRVWGWRDSNGNIAFYPQEQTQMLQLCPTGDCPK